MFGATLKVFRYKYKFLKILHFDSESVVNTYLQPGCDPAGVWHSTVPLWCLRVHQKQKSNPSLATLLSAGAYRRGHPPSEPSTPACLPQHSSTPQEIPPQTHTFPKWDAPGTGWVFRHLHPSCPPPQALSPWILLWRRRWPSSLSLSPAVGGRREPPRCSPGVLSSSLHGVCAQASCSTWRHLVSSGCPSSAPVFFSTGPVQQVGYNPLPPKAGEAGKLKLFLQWNPVKWNTALVFYLKTPGAYFFKILRLSCRESSLVKTWFSLSVGFFVLCFLSPSLSSFLLTLSTWHFYWLIYFHGFISLIAPTHSLSFFLYLWLCSTGSVGNAGLSHGQHASTRVLCLHTCMDYNWDI